MWIVHADENNSAVLSFVTFMFVYIAQGEANFFNLRLKHLCVAILMKAFIQYCVFVLCFSKWSLRIFVYEILDQCQILSDCPPTPPLTKKQSTNNKLGLMPSLGRGRWCEIFAMLQLLKDVLFW